METLTLRQQFTRVVTGYNFMTPNVLHYRKIKNGVAEISEGDFLGEPIYGVTVVRHGEHDYDACQSFRDYQSANKYVKSLA